MCMCVCVTMCVTVCVDVYGVQQVTFKNQNHFLCPSTIWGSGIEPGHQVWQQILFLLCRFCRFLKVFFFLKKNYCLCLFYSWDYVIELPRVVLIHSVSLASLELEILLPLPSKADHMCASCILDGLLSGSYPLTLEQHSDKLWRGPAM